MEHTALDTIDMSVCQKKFLFIVFLKDFRDKSRLLFDFFVTYSIAIICEVLTFLSCDVVC